jgi:hypothetical protein
LVPLNQAGFETTLGVGYGEWDFIVEENLSDAMALLSECVSYVVDLPPQLLG